MIGFDRLNPDRRAQKRSGAPTHMQPFRFQPHPLIVRERQAAYREIGQYIAFQARQVHCADGADLTVVQKVSDQGAARSLRQTEQPGRQQQHQARQSEGDIFENG